MDTLKPTVYNCPVCRKEILAPNPGGTCDECYALRDTHLAVVCRRCRSIFLTKKTFATTEALKRAGLHWRENPEKLTFVILSMRHTCDNCSSIAGKVAVA